MGLAGLFIYNHVSIVNAPYGNAMSLLQMNHISLLQKRPRDVGAKETSFAKETIFAKETSHFLHREVSWKCLLDVATIYEGRVCLSIKFEFVSSNGGLD